MANLLVISRDGNRYSVDTEKQTIQGGQFTEPVTYVHGDKNFMAGSEPCFELKGVYRNTLWRMPEIASVYAGRAVEEVSSPKKAVVVTHSKTNYVVDFVNHTISGGRFLETPYANVGIMDANGQFYPASRPEDLAYNNCFLCAQLSNGQVLKTSGIETVSPDYGIERENDFMRD